MVSYPRKSPKWWVRLTLGARYYVALGTAVTHVKHLRVLAARHPRPDGLDPSRNGKTAGWGGLYHCPESADRIPRRDIRRRIHPAVSAAIRLWLAWSSVRMNSSASCLKSDMTILGPFADERRAQNCEIYPVFKNFRSVLSRRQSGTRNVGSIEGIWPRPPPNPRRSIETTFVREPLEYRGRGGQTDSSLSLHQPTMTAPNYLIPARCETSRSTDRLVEVAQRLQWGVGGDGGARQNHHKRQAVTT